MTANKSVCFEAILNDFKTKLAWLRSVQLLKICIIRNDRKYDNVVFLVNMNRCFLFVLFYFPNNTAKIFKKKTVFYPSP